MFICCTVIGWKARVVQCSIYTWGGASFCEGVAGVDYLEVLVDDGLQFQVRTLSLQFQVCGT